MAVYTDFIFCATLKRQTPAPVIDTLLYLVGEGKRPQTLMFDDPVNPLAGGEYQSANKMWLDRNSWRVSAHATVKNSGYTIEKFVEWIKPWVESGFGNRDIFAFAMHEDADNPVIYALYEEL
jgi:hypothetical protein